jgi:cobalt-zinc-cadmium efflux system outer membrane protein
MKPLDDFRNVALDARPDLRAALQSIEQAKTNHQLAVSNGSTDPTFGAWYTYNPSFKRNQGEKKRTLIDIDRNLHLTDVARA